MAAVGVGGSGSVKLPNATKTAVAGRGTSRMHGSELAIAMEGMRGGEQVVGAGGDYIVFKTL